MPEFKFNHNNINVLDLEKSLDFYKSALGLVEVRRHNAADGSFILVYLGDGTGGHRLELTWLRDRKEPYNLGENEFHLAFTTDDFDAAHELHSQMGCICYENPGMGIYFIADPDNYWLEVVPEKRMR
ncbi:MAG TPA: lactoylglutathione lyase [Candidatus Riflebacteria bacterium]|jgi:lactoylglutathione lyase|nr:lactoylglutathione lyase [Candidatus Riflebacteria bacterium]